MDARFRPAGPQVDFPELEERVLAYWRERGIVGKGLARNEGAPEWVFYEGPPTANARPHVGHVETRVFKDVFPRYQAMRGRYVHRKGGWDCHGLPVELEIEKELGLSGKRQIEEYGIERFNALCRESVQRYVADWERLTERIGFWISMEDAYWTMTPEYVESVWWSLKKLFDDDLLFQDYRSAPYCPRCETALSDHEVGQPEAYRTVQDPSIYVRFPLEEIEADLLVWTTTPWTLPSNLAVAIHPDVTYVKAVARGRPAASDDPLAELFGPGIGAVDDRPVIVAEPLVERVLGPDATILERVDANILHQVHYIPPYTFVWPDRPAWFVITEEFVTTTDGTGIVHIAPAFGAEDLEAGKRHGLPFVNLVDASGRFVPQAGPFAGLGVKEADPRIIADLNARGLLYREETYEHNYPHCWRCKTPLLYYAKSSWYVRTTVRKEALLEQNEKTSWYPETIKHGRYGEWLRNNVDWALSRDRYWGTPLPIWRCPEGHDTCVGSRAELSGLAGRDLSGLDPHRPFVDDVRFPCPACDRTAERVHEVIDAWYDSGSMPFAQWGYPHDGAELLQRRFPADFIAEALDQTRGWFYSLMACSTLLFGRSSYRNVLCLGLFVDEEGRKMSKSLGNVIDPWELIGRHGADALRWFMLTSGSPWANRRLGPKVIDELLRRYLITLWNTYSFFVTYANLDGFDPGAPAPERAERPGLDRWILAELDDAVRETTDALESYDALRAGRRLDQLVDDLSNWYVRRSRRRFWRSGSDAAKTAAYNTLYECLVTLSKLTAPFTPFVAEEIFTNLTGGESVHLEDWPSPGDALDAGLMGRMRAARQIVSLGRAARNEAKVKTRQPLPRALILVPHAELDGIRQVDHLISEELNVKRLEFVDSLEQLVHYTVKPNFRALGPRLGARMPKLAAAVAAADPRELRDRLAAGGIVRMAVDGENMDLTPQDLEVRAEKREGYAVAHEGPYGVALDLEITPELRLEGIAREVVRAVNDARKEAGLEIADRIGLYLGAGGEVAEAVAAHRDWVGSEVLAATWEDAPPDGGFVKQAALEGATLTIGFARAGS